MNEYELIDKCRNLLNDAESSANHDNWNGFTKIMIKLMELLFKELVSDTNKKSP